MLDPDDLDNRNDALLEALIGAVERVVVPYHRAEVTGLDNVPDGPALYVGNHNGATLSIDSFILGAALYRLGPEAFPYSLAHDLIVDLPVLNHIVCSLGGVRATPNNARRLFERGRKILVYPGGDVEATRPYRRRNEVDFDGRAGFARLAIANEVPVIPVAATGAHATLFILHDFRSVARLLGVDRRFRYGTWPLAFMLPWGFWFGPLPPYLPFPAKVTLRVLEPMWFEGGADAAGDEAYVRACAARVESAVQRAVTEAAASP